MAIKRSQLKKIIKECLVEIINEENFLKDTVFEVFCENVTSGNQHLFEQTQQASPLSARKSHPLHHRFANVNKIRQGNVDNENSPSYLSHIKYKNHQNPTSPKPTLPPEMKKNPLWASLAEDTMATTLAEQSEAERNPMMMGAGSVSSVAPEQLFEGAGNWGEIAGLADERTNSKRSTGGVDTGFFNELIAMNKGV